MEASSLANDEPRIESVFGPLTDTEDQRLRGALAAVDQELRGLAAHFGGCRAGWSGTGLDLMWAKSGQVSIGSHLSVTDDRGNAVEFYLELRPAWFYGDRTGEPGWDIEASVHADCQHDLDHGGMDTVWDRPGVRLATPDQAVQELVKAARDLRELGEGHPLTHWRDLATR